MIEQGILVAVIIVLVLAAIQDMAVLRIANAFTVLVIGLFIAWIIVRGVGPRLAENIGAFGVYLLIGIALFARGWLGGGDVKLLAAISLWFGWPGSLWLAAYVGIAGGIFAVLLIVLRRLFFKPRGGPPALAILAPRGPIPYGVAIAIGAIACLIVIGPSPSTVARERAPIGFD